MAFCSKCAHENERINKLDNCVSGIFEHLGGFDVPGSHEGPLQISEGLFVALSMNHEDEPLGRRDPPR